MSWNYMLDLYTLFSRCVFRKVLCVQLAPSIILRGPSSYSVFLWDVPTETALEALRERSSSFSKPHFFCIQVSKNQEALCVLKWSSCVLITDTSLEANVSSKWRDGRKHVLSSLSNVPWEGTDAGLRHKYCSTPSSETVLPLSVFSDQAVFSVHFSLLTWGDTVCVCHLLRARVSRVLWLPRRGPSGLAGNSVLSSHRTTDRARFCCLPQHQSPADAEGSPQEIWGRAGCCCSLHNCQ